MLAVVEDLLDTWPGTLIVVSHDRNLMERVTDNQYALIDGTITHCPGGVDEYLERLDEARAAKRRVERRPQVQSEQERPKAGLSNIERRELKRRFDAAERKMARREEDLERLEAELAATDPTDFAALLAKQGEIDAVREEVADLETEWLELAERLDIG